MEWERGDEKKRVLRERIDHQTHQMGGRQNDWRREKENKVRVEMAE